MIEYDWDAIDASFIEFDSPEDEAAWIAQHRAERLEREAYQAEQVAQAKAQAASNNTRPAYCGPTTSNNIYIGAIVTIKGFGGYAKVLNLEEDGVSPAGTPKYRAIVRFGPNSGDPETNDLQCCYEFAAGRCTNIDDENKSSDDAEETDMSDMNIDELKAFIAACDAKIAELTTPNPERNPE